MPLPGILFLTPDAGEAAIVRGLLAKSGLAAELVQASHRDDFAEALSAAAVDLVLARDDMSALTVLDAMKLARAKFSGVPVIAIVREVQVTRAMELSEAGVDDCVSLASKWSLVAALRRGLRAAAAMSEQRRIKRRDRAMTRLLAAVQELSLARDVPTIQAIVRRAARDLTGAQGATFVLRDADRCYYADEDAIAPLWKGQRFPMSACISGWVMNHRQPVVIEDIYNDPRVPVDAYRPTFVKSMLMVPIRTEAPIGAIGNYWADHRRADPEEVELLQALANTTAVAMENVRVYSELEQRVKDRTQLLEQTNRELEAFSLAVSHDLRSPLTAILGYTDLLRSQLGENPSEDATEACDAIALQAQRMSALIRDLLRLGQVSRGELKLQQTDLGKIALEKLRHYAGNSPHREVEIVVADGLIAHADPDLIGVVLENLLANAWKYTSKTSGARIEFGRESDSPTGPVFFVKDNGAGFNPAHAERLFAPFQRLHAQKDFPGVGIGLATVQRIVHKHGGRIWAAGKPGEGATFSFFLPREENATAPSFVEALVP